MRAAVLHAAVTPRGRDRPDIGRRFRRGLGALLRAYGIRGGAVLPDRLGVDGSRAGSMTTVSRF